MAGCRLDQQAVGDRRMRRGQERSALGVRCTGRTSSVTAALGGAAPRSLAERFTDPPRASGSARRCPAQAWAPPSGGFQRTQGPEAVPPRGRGAPKLQPCGARATAADPGRAARAAGGPSAQHTMTSAGTSSGGASGHQPLGGGERQEGRPAVGVGGRAHEPGRAAPRTSHETADPRGAALRPLAQRLPAPSRASGSSKRGPATERASIRCLALPGRAPRRARTPPLRAALQPCGARATAADPGRAAPPAGGPSAQHTMTSAGTASGRASEHFAKSAAPRHVMAPRRVARPRGGPGAP